MEMPDVGTPKDCGPEPEEPGLVERLFNDPIIVMPLVIILTGIIVALAVSS